MLLQITWQARKKVVPLVPVIATSHETRSKRNIPLDINTDETSYSQRVEILWSELDETIHEDQTFVPVSVLVNSHEGAITLFTSGRMLLIGRGNQRAVRALKTKIKNRVCGRSRLR